MKYRHAGPGLPTRKIGGGSVHKGGSAPRSSGGNPIPITGSKAQMTPMTPPDVKSLPEKFVKQPPMPFANPYNAKNTPAGKKNLPVPLKGKRAKFYGD